jgi:ribose transport system ATP-binding protein
MAFVHQDLGLIPAMSVLENLALGRGYLTGTGGRIRWGAERRRALALMEEFGHPVRPDALVRELSAADQTLVAIVRGLQDAEQDGRVLVLDEPTARLPEAEAVRLFAALRGVARRGVGIVYVSHRLREIFDLADRVTVLRDGRNVATLGADGLTERKLVELIVGRALEGRHVRAPARRRGEAILRARDLRGRCLRGVSLDLHAGEILGIGGLLGSGRSELGRIVAGAQRPAAGALEVAGAAVQFRAPADAIAAGVVRVPEDRRKDGSFQGMTLAQNLTLPVARSFWRTGLMRRSEERRVTQTLIERVGVKPAMPERRFSQFSGGNQQKAVVAKWLQLAPRIVVFDEPGQGVDVGSKAEIYRLVRQAAEEGAGVLVIDSDLDDLVTLCHRILVLREGRVAAELEDDRISRQHVLEIALTTEVAS